MQLPAKKYDLLVSVGNGLTDNWQLPHHVQSRLGIMANFYHNGLAPKIALCGKWSKNWDIQGITPPITEAQSMATFLHEEKKIPFDDMYLETSSLDTIGNAYFLKTEVILPNNLKSFMIFCPDYKKKEWLLFFKKYMEANIIFT